MRTLGITAAFVIIFTLIAGAATFAWLLMAPMFTCQAILEVRAQEAMSPEAQAGGAKPMTLDDLKVLAAKYASLAGSEPVLQTALASPEVRATTWLQNSPEDALERLKAALEVRPMEGSAMIRVSMTGTGKAELPDIVNAIATAAAERAGEIANRGRQDNIRLIRQERTSLADVRDRIRADLAKLSRESPYPATADPNGQNTLAAQLGNMSSQVSALELELAQADAQLQLIRQQIQAGEVASLPAVAEYVDHDPALSAMIAKRAEIAAGIAKPQDGEAARAGGGDALAAFDKQIAARKSELVESRVKSIVAQAEANKAMILGRLAETRNKYRLLDVNARDARATFSAQAQLQEQDKALTGQINRLDARLADLRISLQGSRPLEVMQLASTPLAPTFPKWVVTLPAGAAVGLVLGLLVSLALAYGGKQRAAV